MDRETIQILLDLLNPLHGELDRQTYDQKVRDNFDAPADSEYNVDITVRMERDLAQAVIILENRLRDPQLTEQGVASWQNRPVTETQIKYMVDRFLGWNLPENFSPDAGISFKPTFNDHLPQPTKHKPSGTNLLDATQATTMVRYMIEGLPS